MLAVLLFPLVRELKHLSYDVPFLFRPKVEITNAVIIYMDEDSHTKLHQVPGAPWHRALHVQLLRKLTEQRAAAVVFDILFDLPWTNYPGSDLDRLDQQLEMARRKSPELDLPRIPQSQVDQQFDQAAANHGKVVLAAEISKQKGTASDGKVTLDAISYRGPFDLLAGNTNIRVGVIAVPYGPGLLDGVRKHFQSEGYTSMASAVAGLMGKSVEPPGVSRWINYYGPRGKIPSKSYYQVLQRDGVRPDFFTGKVVFVGKGRITTTEGQSRDDYPTPYNLKHDDNTQGVEIQATACLNYLAGDWLIEMSDAWQIVLFIFCGTLFGLVFAFVRPWIAVITAIFAFAGVVVAGVQTVWQTHIWFSWAVIALVQIPAPLTWALLINTRQLYREKVALEKKLATVTSTPPATASPPETTLVGTDETMIVPPGAKLPHNAEWLAQPGDVIADHQLVRCVGEGSYGQVWLARNVIGTYTAIKLVYRSKFKDEVPFEREFQGLKRFMPVSRGHPGLVQILHVGKTAGYFYYVMEPGDDETTQQTINPETYTPRNLSGDLQKRAKLPAVECLKLAIDLSAALEYLHQRQLIHRDIKPSNIIFVNGQPKIADIGLVTAIATTRTDATYIGTPGYIPPEGPGTPAADIYSLGKVIYEASMGRHVSQCPALPTSLVERSDYKALLELNEIVTKAAAENVQFRYHSAAALHADLVTLEARLAKGVKIS
jgi:CHASE2 domain-containing sensor protein